MLSLVPLLIASGSAFAVDGPGPTITNPQVAQAVQNGVDYLRRGAAQEVDVGHLALAAVAMYKAGVPATDPGLGAILAKIDEAVGTDSFRPTRGGGTEVYEAGVISIAMSNIDPKGRKAIIASAAQYLMAKQKPNGCWDYDNRQNGDTSISQYAVLGLWEAHNSGAVKVPPAVWDNAASWYLSVQSAEGSWNYHRDDPNTWKETVSMTAAGVGSLLICKAQLKGLRDQEWVAPSTLLVPVGGEAPINRRYTVKAGFNRIDEAVRRGVAWISANFDPVEGKDHSPFYALYGLERVGSLLGGDRIGEIPWFDRGSQIILSKQSNGGWDSRYGPMCNSSWAVLFLTQATRQSVERVKRAGLGAGTLLGGRYLPKDLGSVTIARGRVVVRPMNGAIEGMLAVLENPDSLDAESAYAGLVDKYEKDGPRALRPLKDRLARLLREDKDPGIRGVAAWALARTGDLDVVPRLVEALGDNDNNVRAQARTGLMILSRKLDGYGPAEQAPPEARKQAQEKWAAWYESVRPLGTEAAATKTTSGG